MYKLEVGSINIPEIYVSENKEEDELAVENGFPFISYRGQKEKLIKIIMLPYLEEMFPKIKWLSVLKLKKSDVITQPIIKVPGGKCDTTYNCSNQNNYNVTSDIATDHRSFKDCGGYEVKNGMTVGDVIWGNESKVNIEELQALKLMPVFLDDIISSIKVNLQGMDWREGYNKKVGSCLGVYDQYNQPDNLIILDISGSIPRGISDTMLTLLATFKEQLKADVIVTGSQSYYWSYDDELPSPNWIRGHIGCGNEEEMFSNIMKKNISNRKFGHVISFGDNDAPEWWAENNSCSYDELNIEVGEVWHFHTWAANTITGYAGWADRCCKGTKHYNTTWCKCIEEY